VSAWNYLIYSQQLVQSTVIILEEVVDTVQEMVRPLVRDIRDRRLVLELLDQASKVVRCHYIDVFLREDLQIVTLRKSLLSTSAN
jgi:hypothetical protein